MIDPLSEIESILGMPGSGPPPVPPWTPLAAETHNVLMDIATQLRIANLIAYAAHRNEHTDATGPRDVAPALRLLLGDVDFAIREGLGL